MDMRPRYWVVAAAVALLMTLPAQAFIVDDFSVSDPASGFMLELTHTELLESHLETGLPNGNVFGGARYVQLDWQGIPGGMGPFPGDDGVVRVNQAGPGEVGAMVIDGDSRFSFNYGRAAGVGNAFGPFDWTGTDILKVTLDASVAEPLTFGMFLFGELGGATQLWSSIPFSLAAGETELYYDIPQGVTFTAYDSGSNPFTASVGDLLEYTTGLTVYWKGWDNPDTLGAFSITQIEMVSEIGKKCDLDKDGDCDADDIDILCANLGGDPDKYDFDGDSDVDEDDLIFYIENLVELQDGSGRTGTKRGDFNLDGVVNATDLQIQKAHFGTFGAGYADGNANCDTVVNVTDTQILKSNFGFIAPVPEPITLSLLAVSGVALLRRRRR